MEMVLSHSYMLDHYREKAQGHIGILYIKIAYDRINAKKKWMKDSKSLYYLMAFWTIKHYLVDEIY